MILMLCALIPFLGIALTFGKRSVRRSLPALVFAAVFSFICSASTLVMWSRGETRRFYNGFFVSDSSSRLFVALISAVFTGVALYVVNRGLTNPFALRRIQRFVRGALLFFCAAVLAITSSHFILMWIFLEATTLSIAPLIYHEKGSSSVRAAWKYFLFSGVALGMVFLGFVCLGLSLTPQAAFGGMGPEVSFFFQDLLARSAVPGELGVQPWRDLGLALIILGFGTKLGLAPMYTWLPETYDQSPPSVTVLLAAIQFNVVMVAVFRVFQYLEPLQSPIIRYELLCLGLASILVSALHIVVAKNYKRLIAYASINHAGVIAVGLGIGKGAAYGVVLYTISNALVKAVLFLTCGNIKARYHTKSMANIHGLIKAMPFSGWFFMIGIFALLGFAPFGSFFGELLIMKTMIDGKYFALFSIFGLLMTVVFVSTGRATFPMIWGEPKHEVSLHGESIYMLLPKLFFVVLLLSLGIYLPAGANAFLRDIATGVGGR